MSFEAAQATFLNESRELLEEMERALLALETQSGDPELINAVFRAAHTIKGSGGVFGFDSVGTFTHVVENVLDRVRNGQLTIGGDLVAVLLRCRDHIGMLVERAVAGEALSVAEIEAGNELHAALDKYSRGNNPSASLPVEHVSEVKVGERRERPDTWHLSVRFGRDALRNGLDPLSLLRYLKKLGDLVSVTVVGDALPRTAEMDPESCYLGLEIDLRAQAERQEIESGFEFFRDDADIHLIPPYSKIESYIELITALPEENLKIGEILVKGGALTQNELDKILRQQQAAAQDGKAVPRLGELLVEKGVVPKPVIDAAVQKQERGRQNLNRSIRIDADKLDQLINLVGELVISGASTSLLAQRTGDATLLESISMMGRLVEEIRDSALRLRMVQIGETFNRFQRVVRDVSRELDKDIGLEISGAETELDKTVVEKIGDPLMHLVRNAMDHGLEMAAERIAAGKPAQGRVRLHAYHESGSIVIEVADDGRGLNTDRILEKARERGLVSPAQQLSQAEIHRLIFEPGFSTADQVTNLSGRGVGMDVVRRNIEALRGTVDLESIPGHGTTFTIRLPLTLAIIDGFLVGVGDSSYVIPLDTVLECIEIDQNRCMSDNEACYINLRGEVLPFLRLRDMFGEKRGKSARENIVVVQCGSQKAGLVVDALLGEFQTVIKPLGKIFQRLSGISGATILGSGDVAVILDVPQLVQTASARGAKRKAAAAAS